MFRTIDVARTRAATRTTNEVHEVAVGEAAHPWRISHRTTIGAIADELFDRRNGWTLYVPAGTTRLSMETPGAWVYDRFDEQRPVDTEGWVPALGVPALRSVADELRTHVLHPGPAALVEAWDRYWRACRSGPDRDDAGVPT